MKIIDVHQHLFGTDGEVDRLVAASQEQGIVKICLSACGEQFGQPGNNAVRKAFERWPDLIVGIGHIRLGVDPPEVVDELYHQGFRGVKVINPPKNYNDQAFYPIYECLQKRRLPILFHTGIINRFSRDGEFDTACERMRPILLDGIARAFPELTLIGAHLGVPWFDEALCVARTNPNVYFDLSGVADWLSTRLPSLFAGWFGFQRGKWKLLFGVDGPPDKIGDMIAKTNRLIDTWQGDDELRRKIFQANAAGILRCDI